ncbi:CLUMA_CG000263, isoform A [Clunio marinus]|uniref:CLUMA_CG000263, isoform A n=1 Tax=Clunio marinus TaxID=568069 RepID=A0A1J1HF81_9DIPT|nr:CLUMA_CG000263, isoform A [Clunio marinus]
MPLQSINNQQKSKSNHLMPKEEITKSILRNPEVNYGTTNQNFLRLSPMVHTWRSHLTPQTVKGRKRAKSENCYDIYHEPRLNKIEDIKRKLEEVKVFESKICDLKELRRSTEVLINRKVSTKLNFPFSQPIYKNLIKLDDTEAHKDNTSKADNIIKKTTKRVTDSGSKKEDEEIRKEVNDMINDLVDMEYNESDEELIKMPGEESYLGFSNHSKVQVRKVNDKIDTERYRDSLNVEVNHEFFESDEYMKVKPFEKTDKKFYDDKKSAPPTEPVSLCECISGYYSKTNHCDSK